MIETKFYIEYQNLISHKHLPMNALLIVINMYTSFAHTISSEKFYK